MRTTRPTDAMKLNEGQREWASRAEAHLNPDRVRDLTVAVTSIPSPTGQEAELADFLAATMRDAGVGSWVQPLDAQQANAVGRLRGAGTGPDILLYAPIDTLTVGTHGEDVPSVGLELREDMIPRGRAIGSQVIGLGASNPKGHAVAVLAAICALAAADIPMQGDVIAGFGAGGMPTNGRTTQRANSGHGVGCSYLLEQGGWADFAVIAKPGWAVSWEEVGLAWFQINVAGTHTYVGSRHRLAYRNAIADAGWLVQRFEEWFASYTAISSGGTVAPQGIVGAIEGGWWRMPAVTPAECRFLIDLRLAPWTTPAAAHRAVRDFLAGVSLERVGLDASCELVLAIPGTRTDPASFIVDAAIAAWESVACEQHEPIPETSGATDANILRSRGIPTVRVGMPKVTRDDAPLDFAAGMNTVDVHEIVRLTRVLIRAAVLVATASTRVAGLDDRMAAS